VEAQTLAADQVEEEAALAEVQEAAQILEAEQVVAALAVAEAALEAAQILAGDPAAAAPEAIQEAEDGPQHHQAAAAETL